MYKDKKALNWPSRYRKLVIVCDSEDKKCKMKTLGGDSI